MTNRLLQPSFTAGEVAPALYARVDTARYATGLKRCRNFIVRPYGGIENRAGFRFLSPVHDEAQVFRLIPFVYSTQAAYVIELGHLVARVYFDGALVQVPIGETSAYAAGTTYGLHAYVNDGGVIYRSLQAGNLGNTPATSPAWWVADATLVIASPYTAAQIFDVRYTQSADVLFMAHGSVSPRELRRTTATKFTFALHVTREGPFRSLNADESIKVAASASDGTVTLSANSPIFTANAVGALLYLEVKNLGQIKPWVVGDRGMSVGVLRRSDGKTYRAVTVPSGGGSAWTETGNRQPVHDDGRAWDGPGDLRDNGTQQWYVGVEWEYVDSGYGIVEITAVGAPPSASATGIVRKRLPANVVGGAGTPGGTWNLVGDGVTKTFSIAVPDAGYGSFAVTIGGAPVQSNPNYVPPEPIGGGGGGGNFEGVGTQVP